MIPQEWGSFNTRVANGLEIVPWTLWDTVTYTSGTTTRATLFNAVRATKDLGNMAIASMLPNPYAFLCRAPRFFIKGRYWTVSQSATAAAQTGAFDDAQLLVRTGVFEFTIGNKMAFEAPLWMVTAGAGANGSAVAAGATAANLVSSYAQNGAADPRAALSFSKPLVIDSAINFNVTLSWPAAAVTLAQSNQDISVALDGELSRPIQ